jgi:hypothetical protein
MHLVGDALALTFSYPVLASSAARSRRPGRFFRSDYNPYQSARMRGSGDGDRSDTRWLMIGVHRITEILLRQIYKQHRDIH